MCQYQIPAVLAGANPAVIFSDEYVAGIKAQYSRQHAKSSARDNETPISRYVRRRLKEMSKAEEIGRKSKPRGSYAQNPTSGAGAKSPFPYGPRNWDTMPIAEKEKLIMTDMINRVSR